MLLMLDVVRKLSRNLMLKLLGFVLMFNFRLMISCRLYSRSVRSGLVKLKLRLIDGCMLLMSRLSMVLVRFGECWKRLVSGELVFLNN